MNPGCFRFKGLHVGVPRVWSREASEAEGFAETAGPLSTRFVHRWRQSLGNGVVLGVPPAGDALGISDDRRLFGLHPTEAIMKRLEPADFYLFTCKSKLPSGQDLTLTQVSGIKLEASF